MLKKILIIIGILAVGFLLLNANNTDYKHLAKDLKSSHILFNKDKPLIDFDLVDHNNKAFNKDSLKGHWSLLFFGYTHCPDVCPTGLMDMAQLKMILSEKGITPPEVVFVTFDARRDTPEVLKSYITYFDKDFVGVTGDQNSINRIIKPFGAYYENVISIDGVSAILKSGQEIPENINNYLINHTAWIYLINPDGEIFAGFPTPHKVKNMADDIELIVDQF